MKNIFIIIIVLLLGGCIQRVSFEQKITKNFLVLSINYSSSKKVLKLYLKNKNSNLFPSEVLDLLELRLLSITGNECDRIENIENFKCPNIKILPDGISSLKNLEELYLISNDLLELPISLKELPHLKILDLSHNQKINLDAVYFLEKLEELHLNECGLDQSKISIEGLKRLANLKKLSLEDNNLNLDYLEQLKFELPNVEVFF